jgi:hypothetical protein
MPYDVCEEREGQPEREAPDEEAREDEDGGYRDETAAQGFQGVLRGGDVAVAGP